MNFLFRLMTDAHALLYFMRETIMLRKKTFISKKLTGNFFEIQLNV